MDIIIGKERRRWSEEERRTLVAETMAPGRTVTGVARQAGVSPSMLFTWRKRMRADQSSLAFAPLVIAPSAGESASCAAPPATIELELICGSRLRIAGSADPALATAIVKALRRP